MQASTASPVTNITSNSTAVTKSQEQILIQMMPLLSDSRLPVEHPERFWSHDRRHRRRHHPHPGRSALYPEDVQQEDSCLQGSGTPWLQTSSQDLSVHLAEQRAPRPRGSGRPPASRTGAQQPGGAAGGAGQHHQQLHRRHRPRAAVCGEHIAPGRPQPGPQTAPGAGDGTFICPRVRTWASSAPGPGPGPQSAPGPGPGPQSVPEPGPKPQSAPEPGPGPQSVPEPGPGPQSVPEPGPGPQSVPEPGPGPRSVLELGPGPQSIPEPGPGPWSVPEPGPGPRLLPLVVQPAAAE